MAMSTPDDVLGRAAEALRGTDEPGWREVAARAAARLAGIARVSTPVTGQGTTGTFQVSHRVLISVIRRAVLAVPGVDVDVVVLDLAGDVPAVTLRGARIDLVAGYIAGVEPDLQELAERARELAAAAGRDCLGDAAPAAGSIEIRVVDVVDGDPRTDD